MRRGGRRPLRSGAPRMFTTHAGRAARWYGQHFAALAQRFGPFDQLTEAYAAGAAAFYTTFRQDTQTLHQAQEARQKGHGRRPSATAIARLEKRQGLSWQSYNNALTRLEAMVTKSGRRVRPGVPSLAEVMHG